MSKQTPSSAEAVDENESSFLPQPPVSGRRGSVKMSPLTGTTSSLPLIPNGRILPSVELLDSSLAGTPRDALSSPLRDSMSLSQQQQNEMSSVLDTISESESECAVTVNAFDLAASLRMPPALQGKFLSESKGPALRVNHTAVSFEGSIYVYGGRSPNGGGQYFTGVSKYIPSRSTWVELECKGLVPPRRGDHSAVVAGEKMFIYGGRKQTTMLDDMFAYDFLLNSWERILFEGHTSPGPLFNHSCDYCAATRSIYFVGGVHVQTNRTAFVYQFDVSSSLWRGIRGPPTVDPSELQHCIAAVDAEGSKLVVLGAREDPTLVHLYLEQLDKETNSGGLLLDDHRSIDDQSMSAHRKSSAEVHSSIQAAKNKMSRVAESAFTMLLIMDVHTLVWKRIRTEISPESPLSFTMEAVSQSVLKFITKQPHVFSTGKRLWYFPVNLRELDESLKIKMEGGGNQPTPTKQPPLTRRGGKPPRSGDTADVSNAPPSWMATFGSEYGVFIFSTSTKMWSLVPLMLPKKKGITAPGADAPVKREFFTMQSAPDFETKYTLVCHCVKSQSGIPPRDLLVVYGGFAVSDYTFSILTPTIPPKPKGRHALDLANRGNQPVIVWAHEDTGDHQDSTPAQSTPVPGKSQEPTRASDRGRPTVSVGMGVGGGIGRKSRGAKKDGEAVRVVLPMHPAMASAAAMTSMQSLTSSSSTPVVVIDSSERLHLWVSQYYRETCKWLSEQRFAAEKQFITAKRAAIKKLPPAKPSQPSQGKGRKHAGKSTPEVRSKAEEAPVEQIGNGPRPEQVTFSIPGLPKAQLMKILSMPEEEIKARRDAITKKKPQEVREERIRTAAVTGTLLFDAVDLDPDVKPAPKPASSPRRKSKLRQSIVSLGNATKPPVPESPASATDVTGGQKATVAPDASIQLIDTLPRRIARINWAVLRRHVLSGNAAKVLAKVEEAKNPDITWWVPQSVSSAPQLVFNPNLSSYRVIRGTGNQDVDNRREIAFIPTKPVPYHMGAAAPRKEIAMRVSDSGVVSYHFGAAEGSSFR